MEKDIIHAISFIVRSKNRLKLISIINDSFKLPSDITRQMGLRHSQVSVLLSDLKREGIVECLNEDERIGRLYKLTDKGKEAYNLIQINRN
jgi:DNA-binding transcriptional ArsR family regulator